MFFFTLFITFNIATSQVKSIGIPSINNFKRTEYKGGTQNWNIDQDKHGNLYFANNEGLFQFDGAEWLKFSLPNLSSVRSLKISADGRIFVGGYNDFGYFKKDRKGKLKYFSLAKMVTDNIIRGTDFIWKIHIFENKIFFQSFSKVFVFDEKSLKVINAPNKFQFSFIVNNKFYFQDVILGILEYKNGNFIEVKNTKILNNTEIWGMFSLQQNKIIIATIDKGLFLYENENLKPWQTEANEFIKKNSCLGGVLIKEKFLVLNTVLNGIIVCDKSGKIIQHINRKKGLQNNTVLASFVDEKNNLWLALDNGIDFVNENSPFSFFGFSYDLSTVYASVIFKNNLYVATNQGVFYHTWNIPFKEENFKLVEGTTGQAWNIQVVDNQLLCAHNRGALLIEDGILTKNFDEKGYWGFKILKSNRNLMIASNYNGFSIFEKSLKGWQFKNQLFGFNKSAGAFEVDDNFIWFKKDDLLYQLSLDVNHKKIISTKIFGRFSKNEKGIGTIQKIDNLVYFQFNNQFYKYNIENQIFEKSAIISSIFKNVLNIKNINQDQYENIWYVADNDLGVLIKNKDGFKNIKAPFSNISGNLVENYWSVNSIDKNNIFIGLNDGLAHYDAKFINNISTKPKAFIKSLITNKDTIFNRNDIKIKDDIKISYTSNNIKFKFSSPFYDNLENINYSYQLENFDENWSNWSTVSMKEYTNLREGNYAMNLKVKNSYGIISDVETCKFSISPPFYRHFFAYLFYILVFCIIVYLIRERIKVKIRKNKYYETIEQRRLYLEKEAKSRQEQFDLEKEIERLKNDKLQIKILAKDKELVNNSLQVVKKNKILNGIINNIKDIDVTNFDDTTKYQFNKLNKNIVKEVNSDQSWKDLEKHIKNVHFDFLKRLKEKYPTISSRELDLSTYLLMNMSTKEIAEIMNISSGGVELARYRLRKKLNLNKKENLTGFLMGI